jgi:hypothetical protein
MSIRYLTKYIVGTGYLILTLVAETPVIFFSFRNIVENKKRLLVSIITANVVTTIMVAIIESVICRGTW